MLDVQFSQDGGINFAGVAQQVANDGSADVMVPLLNTAQARIRIKCSDNIFFDINDANLSIQSTDVIFANSFEWWNRSVFL